MKGILKQKSLVRIVPPLHLYIGSTIHPEHPSLLKLLKSSHISPVSQNPFPQFEVQLDKRAGLIVQVYPDSGILLKHPSPGRLFPSSHYSYGTTVSKS